MKSMKCAEGAPDLRQGLPPVKQVNNFSMFENDAVPLLGPVWARAVG